jgi:hypothetical protein
MERTRPDTGVDSSPLLESGTTNNEARGSAYQSAARFLRRAGGRRMMREPSMMVRENAAQQLEERQSDWAYSKPVVMLDLLWNLSFVVVSVVILTSTLEERPTTPLRVWIAGYALQCLLHMIYVAYEYTRRNRQRSPSVGSAGGSESASSAGEQVNSQVGRAPQEAETGRQETEERSSIAKRLESVNTMFSFFWWIVGFYWLLAGGKSLAEDAPRLYWLCIVFLAFDVFFVAFCAAVACMIGIAVCCCLPCIIAILYAVANQDGASETEINLLPKYRFCRIGPSEKNNSEKSPSYGGVMTLICGESTSEQVLGAEDAECCICLSAYEDGVELYELPCNHHFHCGCIAKWLRINATCPLCKYNVVKNDDNGSEDV